MYGYIASNPPATDHALLPARTRRCPDCRGGDAPVDPCPERNRPARILDSSQELSTLKKYLDRRVLMKKQPCAFAMAGYLLYFLAAATAEAQENWPQFRGPRADGVAEDPRLPDRWSATENVAWKQDIPGRGWSSPIVWGDRVFLTTVINLGESEEPKKGLYFGGDRPTPPESPHQWKVYCLDLASGDVLWEKLVHEGRPESPIHLKNSYASETPVTDGERLYCTFGNVGIFCFDLEGQELWKHPLKPVATRYSWGTAASPVLHQDRIFFVNDNEENSYLRAIDAQTGKTLWEVARDEKSNWATPFVWENSERTEIVTPGTDKVRSYDLDGKLLWSLTGMSSITIATPQAHHGLLYISSGYVMDPLRPVYAIRPGAEGDISLPEGESSNDHIAWSQSRGAPYNPTPLIYEDRMYVLYDRGLLACFDAHDGRVVFGQQRLPNGIAFTSSPWAYGGKVFCLNEDGVTFVIKAGDEFELLHTNSLGDDDMCMATPAIVGDRLLIRTSSRVYCIARPSQDSN
jgi:outer membrane protein assembly factor BamB